MVLHCTATPAGREVTGDDIRRWHTSPVSQGGRGWKQVGYTDLFHLDGSVERLVNNNEDMNVDPWEITNGAAGYNSVSRHIVYAGGRIRQLAIWAGDVELTADDLVKIQGVADALDEENALLSVLYAPKVSDVTKLPADLAGGNKCRVSVVIAQAGSGDGADLYADTSNKTVKATVSAIGIVLGLLSSAAVHQSIGWVKNFPTQALWLEQWRLRNEAEMIAALFGGKK